MQEKIRIIKEDSDVNSRLAQFDATKNELHKIVHAVVAARNDAVFSDPINAAGMLGYIYGTRTLREIFMAKGWQIDRAENIESVCSPDKSIKIIYQNVDSAANPFRDPKAISGKGPAAARMLSLATPYLFPEWEKERKSLINSSVWFFCVSVDEDDVRAELSCPISIEGGQFGPFFERIFIVESGEWGTINLSKGDLTDLEDQDFEVNVTRK